ncbi:hypothetical protein diail_10503 [Diaporthe ilicicola]|nr:hypothetical protein diail_10503 [Diaporthe ilicicola]
MNAEPRNPSSTAIAPALVRKLVTIREITHVQRVTWPWEKRLLKFNLDGGRYVVDPHPFQLGQLVIFFEVDSFIPTTTLDAGPQLDHIMENFEGKRGFHVRSEMICGHLSQGIIIPVSMLPQIHGTLSRLQHDYGVAEGLRIAKMMAFEHELGVKKWDAPVWINTDQNYTLGPAPAFLRQPGCPSIQNKREMFAARNRDRIFEITEKLDGVSMTIYRVQEHSYWDRLLPDLASDAGQRTDYGRVGIATRREDIAESTDDEYWTAANDIGLPAKFSQIDIPNVAMMGELIGPAWDKSIPCVRGGRYQFVVFKMFNMDTRSMIEPDTVRVICNRLVIPHVPLIARCRLSEFATDMDDLVRKADGLGFYGQKREGLVFKMVGQPDVSFKVISPQWLLERGE